MKDDERGEEGRSPSAARRAVEAALHGGAGEAALQPGGDMAQQS